MNIKLWNVYKLKENCNTKPFCMFKNQLYLIIEYANPIEFYNEENRSNSVEGYIILKDFYPDRHEYIGISTYALTKEQFEECFKPAGRFSHYMKHGWDGSSYGL